MDPLTIGLAIGAWWLWYKAKADSASPGVSTGYIPETTPGTGVTVTPLPATPAIPAPPPVVVTPPPAPVTGNKQDPVPNWGALAGVPGAAAAGYDVTKFPSFEAVRAWGYSLGYKTATAKTGKGLLGKAPGEPWVQRFQRNYNSEPAAPGTLTVDGVPGANTLNAMEWAEWVPLGFWASRFTGTP